jgi:hypothetical protein
MHCCVSCQCSACAAPPLPPVSPWIERSLGRELLVFDKKPDVDTEVREGRIQAWTATSASSAVPRRASYTYSSAGIASFRARRADSLSCSTFASGANQRCAIAVGTIADDTTTVTSSENCVRSMIPAFSP